MGQRCQFEVYQGDITQLAVDAIVNAANSSLLGGAVLMAPSTGRQALHCLTPVGHWVAA